MNNYDIQKRALLELTNVIDEKHLKCWFMSVFHNYSLVCGQCGQSLSNRARKSFLEYRWIRCSHCGKKVHFFQNTLLGSAKISPEVFYLLAVLLQLEVPVKNISEVLGISKTAVRLWAEKFNRGGDDAS